jgi:hypothetical protein
MASESASRQRIGRPAANGQRLSCCLFHYHLRRVTSSTRRPTGSFSPARPPSQYSPIG